MNCHLLVFVSLLCRSCPTSSRAEQVIARVFVTNQLQLDRFLDNITLQREGRDSRCIHLTLTTGSYQLNITKFVHAVDLKNNDSLIVRGESSPVTMHCVAEDGTSNGSTRIVENLLNRRLLNASMIVFDGLVFTGCVLPVYVEEVSTVVIRNCVFR